MSNQAKTAAARPAVIASVTPVAVVSQFRGPGGTAQKERVSSQMSLGGRTW
jgi:hypothetical protein